MIKKIITMMSLGFMIQQTYAYGMAVTLDNIVLYNSTKHPITLNAPNISKSAKINLNPHSGCSLNKPVFFQTNMVSGNKPDDNFYIVFSVESQYNAVFIDKQNRINLASKSRDSDVYSNYGFSKFSLTAVCENNKFDSSPISTRNTTTLNNAPTLAPKYCKTNKYTFVFGFGNALYTIKDIKNVVACVVHE